MCNVLSPTSHVEQVSFFFFTLFAVVYEFYLLFLLDKLIVTPYHAYQYKISKIQE